MIATRRHCEGPGCARLGLVHTTIKRSNDLGELWADYDDDGRLVHGDDLGILPSEIARLIKMARLAPDSQRIEHLIRARDEVISVMAPVSQRTNFVEGQLAAIVGLLNGLIDQLLYP